MKKEPRSEPSIRDIFPDMTDEEVRAADENIDRYLVAVLRVYDHIVANDPQAHAELIRLTEETKYESMDTVED